MYASFIQALPDKVRSADFKDEGTKFRRREKALGCRYVELNQLYKKFIALDIDEPASAYLWDERGLPPPSIRLAVQRLIVLTQRFLHRSGC